jgi:Ca-activated chloride channel homolog
MNSDSKINLDDPKLTAFALGELEGEEAIQMKQVIDQDPEAKKHVDEIRATASLLSEELKKEERPRLSVAQREEILAKTVGAAKSQGAWWKSWKVGLSFGGTLAAAVLAILVMNSNGTLSRLAQVKETDATGPISGPPQDLVAEQKAEAPAELAKAAKPVASTNHIVAMKDTASDTMMSVEAEAPITVEPQPPAAPSATLAEVADMAEETSAPSGAGAAAPAKMMAATGALGQAKALSRAEGYSNLGGLKAAKKGATAYDSLAESKTSRARPGLQQTEPSNTEAYSFIAENDFKQVADQPLSTFSTDVDTASYANVRRFLVGSQLPPADAVRIEEMVNYFKYDYPAPKDGKAFSVTTEVAAAPWNSNHQILRIGLKGRETSIENRPASNLVFLIDVSGSMDESNKLPLLVKSFKLLVEQMRAKDHVALVVYAGNSGVVLPSTTGTEKAKIVEALDRLHAGGSTNGASGIQLAYDVAQKGFIKGGVNRVIIATDGDFNVGMSSEGDLTRMIEQKAKTGVFLTVLGFGMGNYKDATMQKLADKGNGNHAYIDSIREARKVLVEQAGGTLNTIAKDVKIQLEFNPKFVGAYRLIGYEKRLLNNEDFNDDTKDAGEIGEGHTVTALYELAPPGEIGASSPKVDAMKYQKVPEVKTASTSSDEMLTLKLRFKKPDGDVSDKIEVPVKNEKKEFLKASSDLKFATSVAGFGMLLRKSQYKGDLSYDQVQQIASQNTKLRGSEDEYRKEFVELVKKAKSLQPK